jgi:hypothetical protein
MNDIYEYFIDNKYTRWYYQIINKARSENRIKIKYDGYESHHIIPKCKPFCGSNDKENLILLTFREHFICHWLLIKMCDGIKKRKMSSALTRMTHNTKKLDRISSSWMFELSKKAYRDSRIGAKHTKESIEKMRISSTGKLHTEKVKKKMSLSHIGLKHTEQAKANMKKAQQGKIMPEHQFLNQCKKWLIIWPDGHEEQIINLTKFCKENGLDQGNMIRVADGEYKSSKGFKCRRLD